MTRGEQPDRLAGLVRRYREEYPAGYLDDRRRDGPDLATALTTQSLHNPDLEQLRKLASWAYGYPGPQPGFNRLLRTREGTLRAAETLSHVLYGQGGQQKVARRLDAAILPDGIYKLSGVGEAILVKALAVTFPDRWIPCFVADGTPEKGTGRKKGKWTILRMLGAPERPGLSPGEAAMVTNDLIRRLLEVYLPPNDPWGMQDFTWWLLSHQNSNAGHVNSLYYSRHLKSALL
jgi:hypothetical protein